MAHIGQPKRVVQGVPKPIIAPQFQPVRKVEPAEAPAEEVERELVPARQAPSKTTQQVNRTLLRAGWYEPSTWRVEATGSATTPSAGWRRCATRVRPRLCWQRCRMTRSRD